MRKSYGCDLFKNITARVFNVLLHDEHIRFPFFFPLVLFLMLFSRLSLGPLKGTALKDFYSSRSSEFSQNILWEIVV